MPWKECTILEARLRFVVLARSGAANMTALCQQFGISRKTGYKWLKRYEQSGTFTALGDQPRTPHHSPQRTDHAQEQRVVELRRDLGWGPRKLQMRLAREGIHLSQATLSRIIKRNGLLKDEGSHRPATQRFERKQPNELWQMDFKGPIRLLEEGKRCHPLAILDDHSRYLVGLFALPSTRLEPVRRVLRYTFQQYGLPKQILTDRGAPFWSTTNALGLTQLSVDIMNQGVRMAHGAVRHPQTQGKVERLHRTLQEAMNHHGTPRTLGDCRAFFDVFRERYNQERPHEALGMGVPAERYVPSQRAYLPDPPPWPYPPTMSVAQLNPQGCLDYQGQRLFVCEALAKQWVGTLAFEARLIVQFRDMLIREIALDTRRGIAFA